MPRLVGGTALAILWACGRSPAPADPEPVPPPLGPVPEAVGPPPITPGRDIPVLPPGGQPPDTVVSHVDVRIGLHVGAGRTDIGGGDGLVVANPAGQELARLEDGRSWRVIVEGQLVGLETAAGASLLADDMLVFRPRVPGRFVRVAGQDYRGEVWVFRDRTGLTIVNRLGIESYLAGVVPLEIGSRRPEELEAVKAQAIVSRTFAVRNMGRWHTDGFDFRRTVADQVYGGVGAEQPLAWQAVRATRGTIITYRRVPIDAFFFSTCGGETAEGTEVFRNA
ncbi:MAG: SpoIID/LytB domain-containing protein, partial [Gemmatimonadales bacterium]